MISRLFVNGRIWLSDGSFADAFGIRDGRFSFVGTLSEGGSEEKNYDEVIDLGKRLVIPGIIDGHVHLIKGSIMQKVLDCSEVSDIETLKDKVSDYRKNSRLRWIVGSNLNVNKLNIDSVSAGDYVCEDQPLYISNYDYHSALCNSLALKETGLLEILDNFSGEEIVFASDKFTGVVREKALNYISSKIPKPDIEYRVNATAECIRLMNSYGITSVSDITLPEDIDDYLILYERDLLNLRVNSYIPFSAFSELENYADKTKHIPTEIFSIKGFKAFWDGALGSETALFSVNYKGKGHNGYRTETVLNGEIYKTAKEIDKKGMQIIIHAIGDLAVSESLRLYESLDNSTKLRHRIEHAQHIRPEDYSRFIKTGVIASVQPLHMKYDLKTVREKLPDEIIEYTHNYAPLLKLNGIVNFGTDFPIVEFNPFENIKYAIKENGRLPDYLFSLNEALKCYTLYNAFSNHNEDLLGSIETGKLADFVIMEDDLFKLSADKLSSAKVYQTYISGKIVYP